MAQCVGSQSCRLRMNEFTNPYTPRTSSPVALTVNGSLMACHARCTRACPSISMSSGLPSSIDCRAVRQSPRASVLV